MLKLFQEPVFLLLRAGMAPEYFLEALLPNWYGYKPESVRLL